MWEEKARKLFEGKKIVSVRYMTEKEAEENDMDARPLCFKLNDRGSIVIPLSDDEGNNGGAFQLIKKRPNLFITCNVK